MSKELQANIKLIKGFKPYLTNMLTILTKTSAVFDKLGLQENCAGHFGMWQKCKECQYSKECCYVAAVLSNIVDADLNIQ